MSLMGLDIGTTGCRSIIFSEDGKTLAQAYKEYPEIYPQPGWVEMNPDQIWKSIKEVISKSAVQVPNDKVKALCPSVLGVAVTPIDKKGNPLYNSLTAVDGRCAKQAQFLEEKLGKEQVFKETGSVISPAWSINKIMWLKENEPETYKNTWKFVLYEDFIMQKLGLEPSISYSLAGLTMAFDSRNKRWSDLILEAAGVDGNLLSKPIPSGEVVGEINHKIADELGLPQKTKAVTGGFDQAMSALGGGLVKDGGSTLCFGTIECVTTAFSEFNTDPVLLKYNHPIYCHVIKDLYITIAWCFTAGALLKWYRDNIAVDEMRRAMENNMDVFHIIITEASKNPSRILVLPHFIGSGTPYLDSKSKGTIIGMSLATTRADIVKGILDSLSYETKWNIETVEMAGIKIGALNLFGGGARNDILPQIKADIFEREVRALTISETGALAAALLAGGAVGIYKNLEETVSSLIKPRKVFYPGIKYRDVYRKTYDIYKDLYPALLDINHRLSDL
ncbi:MAG: FGGY family carbohydrate kinase [Actinobacteria bacterium]|nr:FGGY family carbohydrate kinase [Actinomycetota bacterium]